MFVVCRLSLLGFANLACKNVCKSECVCAPCLSRDYSCKIRYRRVLMYMIKTATGLPAPPGHIQIRWIK